jgi:hypothetical protein
MDLEPGRIGFMSTQRREDRRQHTSCTECEGEFGLTSPAPVAFSASASATVGTAPENHPNDEDRSLGTPARVATNSLQSDCCNLYLVNSAWLITQDNRRSLPPPGAGSPSATGTLTTHRSSLPFIPCPPGFASLHPTLPQFPAGHSRWMERYDGKRDLHLQHAA